MKKMKFGTPSPFKPQAKSVQKVSEKQATQLIEKLEQGQIVDFEAIARKVMETHADTFRKLAESEKLQPLATMVPTPIEKVVEYHTIEKVNTKDKLARRHAKLMRLSMTKEFSEIAEALDGQNELFHTLKRSIHNLVEKNDTLTERLHFLENRKPEEKQIVTEYKTETVIKSNTPKVLMALVILSLALNALILITK